MGKGGGGAAGQLSTACHSVTDDQHRRTEIVNYHVVGDRRRPDEKVTDYVA